jgi:hypothetical protein
MRITQLPHNGNTGVVPPWLTNPVTPTPPTPPAPAGRGWWIDWDWDQPLTRQK